MTTRTPTALISVSDKAGLVELGRAFHAKGVRILSTGGSAKTLIDVGIPVILVSDHTGFPEIMGGRVKTLHPKIHGGILARRGEDDSIMDAHQIEAIDWVVVNLYPFVEIIQKPDVSLEEAIENIDIGGPAMLRSAAKNHHSVTVVCDPSDYESVIEALPQMPDETQRRHLAVKAFAHTNDYDGQISQWLTRHSAGSDEPATPAVLNLSLDLDRGLRYGENPHQAAGLYRYRGQTGGLGLAGAPLVQGKPLSFNNLLDADAAWSALIHLHALDPTQAACVIVKHTNPCGAAFGENGSVAWEKALACDPTSAFGGIVALSHRLEGDLAEVLCARFLEVILAPEISSEARTILAKKPNLRVLTPSGEDILNTSSPRWDVRVIDGGVLVQSPDQAPSSSANWSVVSERHPTDEEWSDLKFAWAMVRSVRSNAIVYAKSGQTLGLGVGQMSRIDSARFGVLKAQEAGLSLEGSAMASEAFFPFKDSIETAAQQGISCVIQPGGSMRDSEVIEAANQAGIAMVFTHTRHFKH